MDRRVLTAALGRFASCALGAVLAGWAVYGTKVFDGHFVYVQVVASGIMVGVVAAAYPVLGLRWLPVVAAVLWLGQIRLTGATRGALLFRDAVYVVGGMAAAVLAIRLVRWRPSLRYAAPVLWAGIFAAFWLDMVGVIAAVRSLPVNPSLLPHVGGLGAVIGLGTGAGYAVSAASFWRPQPVAGDPGVGPGHGLPIGPD